MNIKNLISLNNPIRLFYHYIRWVIAFYLYWNPARDMIVVWVTGTKWKTTVSNIIAKWLIDAWKKVFMFSTVNYIIWNKTYENNKKMTSPSPFVLQKLLLKAKKAWCEYAIIETSSHSIYYNRNYWLDFDIAVFTNLSQDHLDLHKTMEEYANTKFKLFSNLVKYRRKKNVKKIAVINVDNEYSYIFLDTIVDNMYIYWLNDNAQIKAQNIKFKKDFTEFTIKMPSNTLNIKTSLKWEFNIYNILAAFCVLVSQKISIDKIIKTIEKFTWIPWRLEEVPNNKWYKIFIDYAHTENSLKNVLETVKQMEWVKKIITIFWATWDRDKTKRPKMWKVVDNLSDIIILTDDDTYSENSLSIINNVTKWIKRKEWQNFWIIPDRKDAIRTGLLIWQKDDVILIAWKWAETVQVTNKWPIPWKDINVVNKILQELEE